MNINQLKNKNKVVLNTPTNLDFSVFGNLSQTKIDKLIFLIHQINYYTINDGKCKMHKASYYEFLGLSPKDLNSFLNILIQLNLIEQVTKGFAYRDITNKITKSQLSEFVFVNPFQPETGNQHQYEAFTKNAPLFINKWVTDEFTVKPKDKSKFARTPKANKQKDLNSELQTALLQLQSENRELKEQVKLLEDKLAIQAALVAPVEAKHTENTNTSSTTLIAKGGSKIILVNAEKYSDLVINNIKRIYEPSRKIICVKDEFRNNIYFNNVDSVVTIQPVN